MPTCAESSTTRYASPFAYAIANFCSARLLVLSKVATGMLPITMNFNYLARQTEWPLNWTEIVCCYSPQQFFPLVKFWAHTLSKSAVVQNWLYERTLQAKISLLLMKRCARFGTRLRPEKFSSRLYVFETAGHHLIWFVPDVVHRIFMSLCDFVFFFLSHQLPMLVEHYNR